MQYRFYPTRLLAGVAILLGTSAIATVTAHAQTAPVFDTITGTASYSLPSAPGRSFMGQNFSTGFAAGSLSFTSMSVVLASATATTYTNLVLNVEFWNVASNAVAGTTSAFSEPIGGIQTFSFGATTLAANTVKFFNNLPFATPIPLSNSQNIGITLNWQGDTGSGLISTDNLTTAVRTGVPAVGSLPTGTYYRNASGQTNFDFPGSDARQIGANSALGITLFASAPEPGALALLAVGVLPIVGGIRRRCLTA